MRGPAVLDARSFFLSIVALLHTPDSTLFLSLLVTGSISTTTWNRTCVCVCACTCWIRARRKLWLSGDLLELKLFRRHEAASSSCLCDIKEEDGNEFHCRLLQQQQQQSPFLRFHSFDFKVNRLKY